VGDRNSSSHPSQPEPPSSQPDLGSGIAPARRMLRHLAFLALIVAPVSFSACVTEDEDDEGPVWTDGKTDGQTSLFYRTIVSTAQFEALALKNGGVVIQGPSMKFVIDRRTPSS